jgi:secreted trypsin-like serine protease
VISPTVLVTAAHCVAPSEVGAGAKFIAVLGPNFDDPKAEVLTVTETHYDTAFNVNNLSGGHDIGVAILATPTTLTPIPVNADTDPHTLSTVRLVGYGVNNGTAQTGAGRKRTVNAPVDGVTKRLIQIGDSKHDTCQGDSGGPALAKINGVETIVGLTSFGAAGCSGGGYDTRIDLYGTFLAQWL